MTKEFNYQAAGINYDPIDKLKRYAQEIAAASGKNLETHSLEEITQSRGESAYVFDLGPFYGAITIEGLGTKNLIAEQYSNDARYWQALAQDTVAMIANDLCTVGAQPMVISPHWASGSSAWFADEARGQALVTGWAKACNQIGASYAAGETAALPDLINPQTIVLSGSGFGVINPKENLILGDRLVAGDAILLIQSSGLHANGATLVRKLLERLPLKERTLQLHLPSGETFGEALLQPTPLYSPLIARLQQEHIPLHYLVNITGHGWRKLMRASVEFSYQIQSLPPVPEVLQYIQHLAGMSDKEAYGTFNMGAGFALMLPPDATATAQEIIATFGWESWVAGRVETGKKQVVIEPLGIVYDQETLAIR